MQCTHCSKVGLLFCFFPPDDLEEGAEPNSSGHALNPMSCCTIEDSHPSLILQYCSFLNLPYESQLALMVGMFGREEYF